MRKVSIVKVVAPPEESMSYNRVNAIAAPSAFAKREIIIIGPSISSTDDFQEKFIMTVATPGGWLINNKLIKARFCFHMSPFWHANKNSHGIFLLYPQLLIKTLNVGFPTTNNPEEKKNGKSLTEFRKYLADTFRAIKGSWRTCASIKRVGWLHSRRVLMGSDDDGKWWIGRNVHIC